MLPNLLQVAARLARLFGDLDVPYMVTGSLASSAYGLPRATEDLDLIADLRLKHVAPLVASLQREFSLDVEQIRDAVREQEFFNVVHLPTMYQATITLPERPPRSRAELARRRAERIGTGADVVVLFFASPEDTVLQKLQWYRSGWGLSDLQWSDLLGVLKVQGDTLDLDYLRRKSAELGLTDLLDEALEDAGLSP